mmetsp:Transcript_18649/g.60808  ORF Transcript_18649/g.60808 Transcript_18649/m.60808 type:complete len:301 (+) Transcript_18649:1044-1946(+)
MKDKLGEMLLSVRGLVREFVGPDLFDDFLAVPFRHLLAAHAIVRAEAARHVGPAPEPGEVLALVQHVVLHKHLERRLGRSRLDLREAAPRLVHRRVVRELLLHLVRHLVEVDPEAGVLLLERSFARAQGVHVGRRWHQQLRHEPFERWDEILREPMRRREEPPLLLERLLVHLSGQHSHRRGAREEEIGEVRPVHPARDERAHEVELARGARVGDAAPDASELELVHEQTLVHARVVPHHEAHAPQRPSAAALETERAVERATLEHSEHDAHVRDWFHLSPPTRGGCEGGHELSAQLCRR